MSRHETAGAGAEGAGATRRGWAGARSATGRPTRGSGWVRWLALLLIAIVLAVVAWVVIANVTDEDENDDDTSALGLSVTSSQDVGTASPWTGHAA